MTALSTVKVTRFLCTNCGYIEEWVEDREDIERLKDKFDKL